MADITLKDTDEIHKIARTYWKGHFIFRGENSTSYTLLPKFGRKLAKPFEASPGSFFPVAGHEGSMVKNFKRQAVPFLDRHPIDDWDWLAIAQHHGLATRLLDWTSNILVAAYFAYCSSRKSDSVIYALNTEEIPDAPLNKSPFSLKDDVMLRPRHSTARISAQSGIFTSHANPAHTFTAKSLQRIIVPASIQSDLGAVLRSYGITRAKLFPGLDTIAECINEDFACS